ncbi:hypothetical protein ACSTHJ_00325, partial [Vibrio parahaemolyticus]
RFLTAVAVRVLERSDASTGRMRCIAVWLARSRAAAGRAEAACQRAGARRRAADVARAVHRSAA